MDNNNEPCPRCDVRLGLHPAVDPERPGFDRCQAAKIRERALDYL